jgi:Uma2 family endonuclease
VTRQLSDRETPFAVALNFHSMRLTDEQFYRLCQDNEDLRLELTAEGELIIMAPTGGTTGSRNATITARLTVWAENDGAGLCFDSSTMFCLPNGAKWSPDAAWLRRERWEGLTDEQRESFVPLCPDFVLELRSATDSLTFLQAKMQEYIDNGAHLGLFIDSGSKAVHFYRPNQPVECLDNPEAISGEPILPGFVLSLKEIW